MAATAVSSATYFRRANPLIAAIVILGMTLCHLGCYHPTVVPDQYMGPVGWLFRFFVYSNPWIIQVVYHSAVFVHFLEALYSLHLMAAKGITDSTTKAKWFFQTFALGIGSLYFLLKYNPKSMKHSQ